LGDYIKGLRDLETSKGGAKFVGGGKKKIPSDIGRKGKLWEVEGKRLSETIWKRKMGKRGTTSHIKEKNEKRIGKKILNSKR